jgi:hypothetical protein
MYKFWEFIIIIIIIIIINFVIYQNLRDLVTESVMSWTSLTLANMTSIALRYLAERRDIWPYFLP